MTEKMRCIAFACMNKQMKASFNDHFTRILPEDLHSWNRARDAAESAALARRLERDAAAGSLGSGPRARGNLLRQNHPRVTNWAYVWHRGAQVSGLDRCRPPVSPSYSAHQQYTHTIAIVACVWGAG